MTPVGQPQTMLSIQYLRGIAALLVVFHHTHAPQEWLFNPLHDSTLGVVGVDIFFVISGFIMYTAARFETVSEFAFKRIVRVVPLYWLATLGFLALLFTVKSAMIGDFTARQTLQSLLFIPHFHPQKPEFIWPLLVPGWTLNFEMFFYLIFAVGLLVKRLSGFVIAAILSLVMAGFIFRPVSAIGMTYTSPLLLEFLAGFTLGLMYSKASFASARLALPIGALTILSGEFFDVEAYTAVLRGIGAVLLITGCLGFESIGRVPKIETFKLLGAASYSIYLSHILTIHIAFLIWRKVPLGGWVQFFGVMLSGMVIAIAIGVLIYRYVETPILNALRTRSTKQVTI